MQKQKPLEQTTEDPLRGQPFIAKVRIYNNPNDLAYGDQIERVCNLCFYRAYEGNPNGDCQLAENNAKIDFGFQPDQFLPAKLDGKEVGNYCPSWIPFEAEMS